MTDRGERAFLAAYDASRYERPSVTVDVVLLTVRNHALWTLVGVRQKHPAKGKWALPGVFVQLSESLDSAAVRALDQKAGLRNVFIEQLYTFGSPGRDPRTRVISVAYYALVDPSTLQRAVEAFDDRRLQVARLEIPWQGEAGGPVLAVDAQRAPLPLAFDHAEILGSAVRRLRGKVGYASIGYELLPAVFTLRDLRFVHEAILGRSLNKDSFRRRVLEAGLVVPTGSRAEGVGHRPPELFRLAPDARLTPSGSVRARQ